ncbi:hypothetical protein BDV59DRAFT_173585 [Aspergillus ambiguus]|uniref:uncharacterized protein n=1 Tax=Aspergillus ambiguus TaxID=176160 RepID=UPI003CCCC1CA
MVQTDCWPEVLREGRLDEATLCRVGGTSLFSIFSVSFTYGSSFPAPPYPTYEIA